jgi:hypothetical protein
MMQARAWQLINQISGDIPLATPLQYDPVQSSCIQHINPISKFKFSID